MLRFCFVLVSVFGAMLVSSLFTLWNPDNVVEAWMEFTEAKPLSAKKALYIELMLQTLLYVFMLVERVDWSVLLVVFAGFYLDAKNKNFMLMYIVLVSISILFDIVHAASLPAFDTMGPAQSFGESLWIGVFILKLLCATRAAARRAPAAEPRPLTPAPTLRTRPSDLRRRTSHRRKHSPLPPLPALRILGTIYMYETHEKEGEGAQGNAWSKLDEAGVRDDEIAE